MLVFSRLLSTHHILKFTEANMCLICGVNQNLYYFPFHSVLICYLTSVVIRKAQKRNAHGIR